MKLKYFQKFKMDEFNNRNLTNIDERNTIDVPNKQSKYITTRKRK